MSPVHIVGKLSIPRQGRIYTYPLIFSFGGRASQGKSCELSPSGRKPEAGPKWSFDHKGTPYLTRRPRMPCDSSRKRTFACQPHEHRICNLTFILIHTPTNIIICFLILHFIANANRSFFSFTRQTTEKHNIPIINNMMLIIQKTLRYAIYLTNADLMSIMVKTIITCTGYIKLKPAVARRTNSKT